MSSAEELVEQLRAGTPEAQEVADIISRMIAANVDSPILKAAENRIQQTWLHNGTPVTTDTAGTQIDPVGLAYYDRINVINGTVGANTTERRQLDITMNGGGADCMFDVLVSSCFSSLAGWVEGQVFTSLSGCTFSTTATVQKAYDYIRDVYGKSGTVFICAGSYSGGIHVHHDLDVDTYGAGADVTTVYGNANNNTDGYVVWGGQDNGTAPLGYPVTRFRDICFDGTQGNAISIAVYGNQNGIRTHLDNVKLIVPASLNGAQFNGNEFINDLDIIGPTSGTQAASGFTSGNATGNHTATNISINGCDRGAKFTNASAWEISNIYVSGANAARGDTNGAGALCFHTNAGLSNSKISGARLVNSAVAMGFTNDSGSSVIIGDFVIQNCTVAFDIRGSTTGIHNFVFDGGVFILGTAGQTGVDFTNASNNHCTYCQFTNLNFRGYASGNEIINASGTHIGAGTCGYHNISDAGTVADFGSPQGHAGSGSGGAAVNNAAFVTIGNDANLTSERALTGDTAETFTDGGANSTVTHHSIREIVFIMDGGGSTLATGVRPPVQVPFNCTVNSWNLCGDAAGTCTVDLSTATDAATPSFSSIVGAGTKPNVAGPNVCSTATAPASWTSTAITAGQLLQPNLTAVTTFKTLMLALKVTTT